MPDPYWPKKKDYPLSNVLGRDLIRTKCAYCKLTHAYRPEDLIYIYGDVDIDSLTVRMKCEGGDHGYLDVKAFSPTGSEAVGLTIRKLVRVDIKRFPVWSEEK